MMKTTWTHSAAKQILKQSHPKLKQVNAYILGIIDRSIVAGELVRLAVLRHLDDLVHGHERGLRFDEDAALRVIELWPLIFNLTDGEGVRPFHFAPWQQFCMACLFGWMGPEGYRRFQTAYIETGKGSGKSPWAASIGLYGIVGDKETAAQVYVCATKKDQAKETLFNEAALMVENSPWLKARLLVTRDNIAHVKSASFFRLISSDTQGVDGLRPHMVIADEVHMHANAMLINRLRANFKNRRQPLIVEITNSGEDRESVCYHHHEFSESVLRGITPNDTWFAFVCGLDPCEDCRAEGKTQPTSSCKFCDDYRDERVWPKANPNLGVSIQIKYLRNLVAEAQGMPTKEADVKRLNFCIWLQAAKRWLSIEKWDDCIDQYSFRDLLAQRCYAGLDMSNKIDLTAFVLHFPDSGRVLPFFWVPAENIPGRAKNDRVPYDLWADPEKVAVPQALGGGYINPTPGNGVDYASVRRDINKLGALFRMEEIGFDPWNTAQLGQELEADGFKMIIVPQRIAHLTNASTELEVLIHTKRIRHDGNPVLRWCISNMVTKKDAGGAIMPDKAKSRERIDGGMALVTGLSRTIVHVGKHSVYNERGVRTL